MKTIKYFLAVVLFLSCSLTLTAQRPSPCLCDPVSENKPCNDSSMPTDASLLSATTNRITLEIKDDPGSLDKHEGSRYKAFWIWGDGNYRYFQHGEKEDDMLTLRQSYSYRMGGTYNPMVVLTEKKSNKEPPGRTIRKVDVKEPVSTNPVDTFARRLNVPIKTADIFSTEYLRAGSFYTALVVSAPKDPVNTGIFFFYNSISDNKGRSQGPAHVHDTLSIEIPRYVTDAGLTMRQGTMAEMKSDENSYLIQMLSNNVYRNLKDTFDNFIFVPVDSRAMSNMPEGFDEYRFFPILKTVWADTLSISNFMTLVVGQEPPVGDFYDEKRLANLGEVLGGFFSFPLLDFVSPQISEVFINEEENPLRLGFTLTNGDTTEIYARGAARVNVPIVGSIDPNELKVLKICPLENNRYLVTMRLEICNDGYMFEDSILIRLKDAGNHYSNIIFPAAEQSKIKNFRDDISITNFHQWFFSWNQYLEGIYDTLSNGSTEYAPRCASFEFTVETDWAGVQQLQKGEGLEMCVTFSLATVIKEDCGFNFTIKGSVTQSNGFNCGDPCWCNWVCWLIIILVLLLLLYLWWRWYKKKQDNNNA